MTWIMTEKEAERLPIGVKIWKRDEINRNTGTSDLSLIKLLQYIL